MTADACCDAARNARLGNLIMPDGRRVCGRPGHATRSDRDLVQDVDRRGREIKIPLTHREVRGFWASRLAWPYGPNIDLGSRLALVEWAEAEGVAFARSQKNCVEWVLTGRCSRYNKKPSPQARYDHTASSGWLDHLTSWVWAGSNEPAVLVSQPYGVMDEDLSDLKRIDAIDGLRVQIESEGWYAKGGQRLGTAFVGVWRESIAEES